MKLVSTKQRLRAMTLIEVLVVIATLVILAALLLPATTDRGRDAQRVNCVSNLKQINLAFRIWEADNGKRYPMAVSVTNGGAIELITTGNVAACFRVISNELGTTKLLICPADHDHRYADNFDALDASHISYFIGANVTNDDNPNLVLDGDDNLAPNGSPVKSGIVQVSANAIAWGFERHVDSNSHFWSSTDNKYVGNLGFADGSVAEESSSGLRNALQYTSLATNRFAIP